jgi:DNA-binding NtrC family response regulator
MADVLLVDDDGSVLLTLAIALRRHGHRVTVAHNAHQALDQLAHRHFQFLVSDVRMPDMTGIELARQVRAGHLDLRVILTSAYCDAKEREGLAEAFVPKPVDGEQLNKLLLTLDNPRASNRSKHDYH